MFSGVDFPSQRQADLREETDQNKPNTKAHVTDTEELTLSRNVFASDIQCVCGGAHVLNSMLLVGVLKMFCQRSN